MIIAAGRPLYVGSGVNIRDRIRKHFPRLRWSPLRGRFGAADRLVLAFAIDRTYGQHATRELRLIRRLQPPQNVKSR